MVFLYLGILYQHQTTTGVSLQEINLSSRSALPIIQGRARDHLVSVTGLTP